MVSSESAQFAPSVRVSRRQGILMSDSVSRSWRFDKLKFIEPFNELLASTSSQIAKLVPDPANFAEYFARFRGASV